MSAPPDLFDPNNYVLLGSNELNDFELEFYAQDGRFDEVVNEDELFSFLQVIAEEEEETVQEGESGSINTQYL